MSRPLILFLMLAAARLAAFNLRQELTLNGPWITAGDVLDPMPDTALAQVKIKRLPAPGQSLQITKDLVLVKIRDARLLPPGAALPELNGEACLVKASAKSVPGAEILAFGDKYLRERLGSLSGEAEVDVKASSQAKDLLVPDRPVKFQITPRASQNWRGNVMLRVGLLETAEDGSELEVGQAVLPFMVKVKQALLLASRQITRGELISAENTKLGPADASYLREEGYAALAPAEGLKARSAIAAEKPIEASMLERPAVIRRGDIVKLIVHSGLVSVETSARALRDAALGDSIPVEVQEGKKQLQAKVVDSGTVISDTR